MQKETAKIIFSIICAVLLCTIGYLICSLVNNITNLQPKHYCLVKPTVYDAFTGEAIKNATIVSTTDGIAYKCDDTGSADWMPVYYSSEDELLLTSFIAQAEGYKTTVIYFVSEIVSSPLDAPMIYMFTGNKDETISMVYSPSDKYTENLIKQFAQQN